MLFSVYVKSFGLQWSSAAAAAKSLHPTKIHLICAMSFFLFLGQKPISPIPMQIDIQKKNNFFFFFLIRGSGEVDKLLRPGIWLNITHKSRHIIKTQSSWLLNCQICHKKLQRQLVSGFLLLSNFLKEGLQKDIVPTSHVYLLKTTRFKSLHLKTPLTRTEIDLLVWN